MNNQLTEARPQCGIPLTPSSRIVTVIETRATIGRGVSEHDPVRSITAYFTPEGEHIFTGDSFSEAEQRLRRAVEELGSVMQSRDRLENMLREAINLKERYRTDLNYARRHGFKKLALRNQRKSAKSAVKK